MIFKVLEKINPRDSLRGKKNYASIIIEGEFTLDDRAKEIVSFTSLSEADVNFVLIAVQKIAQKKLADGKIVRLGKLGNLYTALSSDGEEKTEDVSVKSIKSVGINYRAGDELIKAIICLNDSFKHLITSKNNGLFFLTTPCTRTAGFGFLGIYRNAKYACIA